MLGAEEVAMDKYQLSHRSANHNVFMILRHLTHHGMQQLPSISLLPHTFLLHLHYCITTHIITIISINKTINQFIMIEIVDFDKWIEVELKELLHVL